MTDVNTQNEEPSQGSGERNAKATGRKLKEAREKAGIHINDLAGRLRLTASQVKALESGRLGQFGATIYVRGYVKNYALQVGLNPKRILAELNLPDDRPPLRAAAGVPPGRRMVESLGRWGSYVIGTVVVVLPIVWWASEGTMQLFDGGAQQTRDVATSADAATVDAEPSDGTRTPREPATDASDRPVMASMAPVRRARQQPDSPEIGRGTAPSGEAANEVDAEAQDAVEPGPRLTLEVIEDSWVELHDADGNRLEYDLLRAGSTHHYEGRAPFNVLIGNAGGIEVRYNDSPFDMTPHMQGNLARFEVGESKEKKSEG